MTQDDAASLELFIKDHDTRVLAKAAEDDQGHFVQVTNPDHSPQEPIRSVGDYESRFIAKDPGPTIKEAWEKWKTESGK